MLLFQVEDFKARLKISKMEYTTILYIVQERDNYRRGDAKYYQDIIIDSSEKKQYLQRCQQLAAYMDDKDVYNALQTWEMPVLPFSAKVFIEAGVPKGKKLAQGVEIVKQKWKDSGFQSTREELEEYAKELVKLGKLT